MKGIQGLIVAVVLGAVGALANFYYLNTEAQKKDMVAFIGIKKGVILGRGDKLSEDKLVKVEIPKNYVGNLRDYACMWDECVAIKDRPVWRTLDSRDTEGGLLLLQSDWREPPKELELGKGEKAAGIIVPKNFTTSLVNPGDVVWFRVPTLTPPVPTRAPKPPSTAAAPATSATPATGATGAAASENADLQPKPEEADAAALITGPSELIGPFVVVSIGNRLGRPDVMKAAKIAQVQENVLNIRISKNVPKEQENFDRLMDRIHNVSANSYDILLSSKQ